MSEKIGNHRPERVLDPVTELSPKGPTSPEMGHSGGETSKRTNPNTPVETFPHTTFGLDQLNEIGL